MIHATSQITLAWNAIEDGLYETSGSLRQENLILVWPQPIED